MTDPCPLCHSPRTRQPHRVAEPEVGIEALRAGLWCEQCEVYEEDAPPDQPERAEEATMHKENSQ